MESQQSARSRHRILFGLVMLALAGTANALPLPAARILINSDRYVVGSRWNLDILVETPDPLTVKVSGITLPSQLVLSDGPYIRETSWEKTPGVLSRATKVTLTLRTQAPGIVEVGPFQITVGSQVQTLSPVTVFLLAGDEAKRRFPVELGWAKPDGPFFEGQAIPLILQARNLDTLAQPQEPGLNAPTGALWEKAVGLGEIEINSMGEDRLMNVPWGAWMLIPTQAGTLTIPGFKGSVLGLDRTVPPLVLDIQPLPAEGAATRAVGNFSYTIDAKEGEADQGDQLEVTQEISGQGNFPYLKLPAVTVPELKLTAREEGTRYRAGKGGYEGSLVVTWRFSSDQARTVTVTLPGFDAFQPKTGRIDHWDSKTVSVALHLPTAFSTPAQAKPLDWAGVQAVRPWGVVQGWWAVVLFVPGPAFLLLTFLVRGSRTGLLVLLVLGVFLISGTDSPPTGFAEALKAEGPQAVDQWSALTRAHPEEPGLWYNQALACRDAGKTSEAVFAFRMALRQGFQGDMAARGLVSFEEKQLITDQFVPWTGWPTSLVFTLFCLAVNLTFVCWGLQRLTGRTGWLTPLALVLVLSVVLGVFVVSAETARTEPDAVIGLADGPIRKVPGDLAETWMTLKAGTVVQVQGASDRWVLVQTGYGLEGWVEASSLLPLAGSR